MFRIGLLIFMGCFILSNILYRNYFHCMRRRGFVSSLSFIFCIYWEYCMWVNHSRPLQILLITARIIHHFHCPICTMLYVQISVHTVLHSICYGLVKLAFIVHQCTNQHVWTILHKSVLSLLTLESSLMFNKLSLIYRRGHQGISQVPQPTCS